MRLGLIELILLVVLGLVPLTAMLVGGVMLVVYLQRPRCPACQGRVRKNATVCLHCRRELPRQA